MVLGEAGRRRALVRAGLVAFARPEAVDEGPTRRNLVALRDLVWAVGLQAGVVLAPAGLRAAGDGAVGPNAEATLIGLARRQLAAALVF